MSRRPRSLAAAALLAALTLVPSPAAAARYHIDARTGTLAYPVIGRDGLIVLDERVVQSRLMLRIDDVLPAPPGTDPAAEPDVAAGVSLRFFANPGVAASATDPANLGFVPGALDMALEVLWAWVEATNLLDGWIDVRLGRIVHDGPLGWRSDDGARLRLGQDPWVHLDVVGGFENVRGLRLSSSPFAPGGVERWTGEGEGAARYEGNFEPEHRPTIETTLGGRLGPVGYDAGYRRTWRSVDGGVAQEQVGFEADLEIDPVFLLGTARVDLATGVLGDATALGAVRLDGGRHRVEAQYEHFRPTFDAESIFWVFAADPFHEISLRYRFPLLGPLRGEAWAGARHVEDPGGDYVPTTLVGPFTDLGGGLGLALDAEAFSASLRWKILRGSTTSLAGADLAVDVPLFSRWNLFAVVSGWHYDDVLRDASYGVGGAGRAGAGVLVAEGVRIEAEAQVAHDSREGTTFAVFAWLDTGVTL